MKKKLDPLVEHGHKVSLLLSNSRAFVDQTVTKKRGKYNELEYTYISHNNPSSELMTWMTSNCGPLGVLWTTVKVSGGMDVYFAVPKQAMLFKLTWGGR
jgi:hypothetical protein